jgi:hypothetical protein
MLSWFLRLIEPEKIMKNPALDSMKIYVDAACILTSACHAAKRILDRRAELDGLGLQDKPLIVVAGEMHSNVVHGVHHMAVLKKLLESKEHVVVGVESDHNLMEKGFAHSTGQPPNVEEMARLQDQDKTGALSLKTTLGIMQGAYESDHTQATFSRFLLQQKIPVRYTDAGFTDKGALDCSDPSTAAALCSSGLTQSRVSGKSPDGVHARNQHMAEMLQKFAADTGARIVFWKGGNSHVAGDNETGDRPEHSLSTALKERGVSLLAMPLLSKNIIPSEHGLQREERLFVTGLPQTTANYHPVEDRPRSPADLQGRAVESAYLNGVMTRCGLGGATLSIDAYKAEKQQCAADVYRAFTASKSKPPSL